MSIQNIIHSLRLVADFKPFFIDKIAKVRGLSPHADGQAMILLLPFSFF